MKKRTIIAVMIITLSVLSVSLWNTKRENLKKETVRIGAILPLTGEQASYASQLKKGMDLAVDLNNLNKNKKIELLYEDDQGDAKKALSAYRKIKDFNNVKLIIGGMFSSQTLAIAPSAERERVILLSPTASAIDITDAGDYIFRIYPSDIYDGLFLSNFALTVLNAKSVAIIYEQISSIVAVTNKFEDTFKLKGGSIIYEAGYLSDVTDFRPMLSKLKQVNPDLIFIPGNLIPITNLLIQAKEMGISVVHQELSFLPLLSVAENLYVNHYSDMKQKRVNWYEKQPAASCTPKIYPQFSGVSNVACTSVIPHAGTTAR